MRAFAILTVSVLIVIGAGIGCLAAMTSPTTVIPCTSTQACFDAAAAWGIKDQLMAPSSPRLSFQFGRLVVNSPADWLMALNYVEPGTSWYLFWPLNPARLHRCHGTATGMAHAVFDDGLKVCIFPSLDAAAFDWHGILYVPSVNAWPVGTSLSGRDRWLLREIGRHRTS